MSRPQRMSRLRLVGVVGGTLAVTATLAGCSHPSSAVPAAARSAAAAISSAEAAASGDPTSGAAGGASSPSTAGRSGADTCSLLSVQQASSLTSKTFVSSESSTLGTVKTCTYDPGGDTTETLRVSVERSAICWDAVVNSGIDQQSVPGVGDAAFGFGTGLDVKHGAATCIEIFGDVRAESTGDWSADIAVAQAILPELG